MSHKKFEYMKVSTSSQMYDDNMNEYGKEGWELVGCMVIDDIITPYVYIFKRELLW